MCLCRTLPCLFSHSTLTTETVHYEKAPYTEEGASQGVYTLARCQCGPSTCKTMRLMSMLLWRVRRWVLRCLHFIEARSGHGVQAVISDHVIESPREVLASFKSQSNSKLTRCLWGYALHLGPFLVLVVKRRCAVVFSIPQFGRQPSEDV